MKTDADSRLFFAAQVTAPWPHDYPAARIIPEETRHITLAFLGKTSPIQLILQLPLAPSPSFSIGPSGWSQELLLIPSKDPRVAALDVKWLSQGPEFLLYEQRLSSWLKSCGYPQDPRPFYSHISLARQPFDPMQWKNHFYPIPFFIKAIHLYESYPNLDYKSIWTLPLLPPFEEIEHTADIAFLIRGTDLSQIYKHAELALAFKYPSFIPHFISKEPTSLNEIIMTLNQLISLTDRECGSPIKAISFHGSIQCDINGILNWEMIIDV